MRKPLKGQLEIPFDPIGTESGDKTDREKAKTGTFQIPEIYVDNFISDGVYKVSLSLFQYICTKSPFTFCFPSNSSIKLHVNQIVRCRTYLSGGKEWNADAICHFLKISRFDEIDIDDIMNMRVDLSYQMEKSRNERINQYLSTGKYEPLSKNQLIDVFRKKWHDEYGHLNNKNAKPMATIAICRFEGRTDDHQEKLLDDKR